MRRRIKPEKLERLVRAIHALHGSSEWTCAMLAKACASRALKQANAELRSAIVACIGTRITVKRLGWFCKSHLHDAHADRLRVCASYDGNVRRWVYSIDEGGTGPSWSDVARAAQERSERASEELELRMMGKPPSRQLDIMDSAIRKRERVTARMQREDEHTAAVEARKETRREERALHEARAARVREVNAAAILHPGRFTPINTYPDAERILTHEVLRAAKPLLAEAERARIDELKRLITRHRLNANVSELLEIDVILAARGRCWTPGMSCNPADYKDYSSVRYSRMMLPNHGLEGVQSSYQYRTDWSPID